MIEFLTSIPTEWVSGFVSGIVSSAIVTIFFYWLAGKDLKQEANDLRHLNVLLIRALHEAGVIDVTYDSGRRPTGLVFKYQGGGKIRLGGAALQEFRTNPQV